MNKICSWSSKLSASWRYFTPVKTVRFTSNETDFSDSLETDFIEKVHDKKEKCINEVTLLGRVGKDANVVTKEGRIYAKFSLATESYWKSSGDEEAKTDWHTIMVFEPTLVNAAGKYIRKGQRLYVSGRLTYFSDGSSNGKSALIVLKNFINISS